MIRKTVVGKPGTKTPKIPKAVDSKPNAIKNGHIHFGVALAAGGGTVCVGAEGTVSVIC